MPSKAVVEQWRAESWAWVEAGDPEAMREDERIVELADMLQRAAELLAGWKDVGDNIEDGVGLNLPTGEWLREWNGPLPFEP